MTGPTRRSMGQRAAGGGLAGLLMGLMLAPMAAGDPLSVVPEPWAGRVTMVAEVDLSGAEPAAREAMARQRQEAARLLADGTTPARELAQAYGRLGSLYHVHGLEAAAEAAYANARALEPGRFRWAYSAAWLAAGGGRAGEALKRFREARDLDPDYGPLALRMGEAWLALGRLDAARTALENAALRPGLRARALYQLAQVDLLERRPRAAIPRLREVLELEPAADAAHYPLARALRGAGDDEAARRHMAARGDVLPRARDPLVTELEALGEGSRQHFAAGLEGNYAAAAGAFAQGLALEPGNHHARVSHARALYLAGEAQAARDELATVLERAPDHALALFLDGLLQEEAGQGARALARYRAALAAASGHYGAHFALANRAYRDGDYASAHRHYEAALAANPDIPPARLYGVLAMKRAGAGDLAVKARLEGLVTAHPGDRALDYALIRLLVLGDGAARDLERARRRANALVQEGFSPPHVALQALVAAALGHFEQAVELQQQALPALLWTPGGAAEEARAALAAYGDERLPDGPWFEDPLMLGPPVTDVGLMMREYPSPVPY